MLPPMFYSYEMMTITQWFDMISYDDPQGDHTHIYKLHANKDFALGGKTHEAGIYYVRTVKG